MTLCTWHSKVRVSTAFPTIFKIMIRNLEYRLSMHIKVIKLIKFSLPELHTLDLLRQFALYTWLSSVDVSAASLTVFQNNDLKLAAM